MFDVTFALVVACVFAAVPVNDTCFPAMLIYLEKSCDLEAPLINEACTNKQTFSSEEETKERDQQ